jgi:hypothetical protein
MTTNNGIPYTVLPSNKVGDILLIGRFGGAVCAYYKIVSKSSDMDAMIVPVNAVTVTDTAGVSHTKFEEV